ncbi:MAG: MerR family transcriptional regulator [Candidatus Nanopelagicales bacterium]
MTSAAATDGLLSIGEVLHSLHADFPDVTITKIRFLEDKGLVEPSRTPSGYRKFSRADLERLRYVLRMQRDHYLPLKVIKEHLAALDRGESPEPLGPADDLAQAAPRSLVEVSAGGADSGEVRLSRKDLLEQAAITNEVLRELESHGLVSTNGGGSFYDRADLQIAQLVAKLAEFGYGPRHLRPFQLAAQREVSLIEQVVKPVSRGHHPDSAARAEETANAIAALGMRLHAVLVKKEMDRLLGH